MIDLWYQEVFCLDPSRSCEITLHSELFLEKVIIVAIFNTNLLQNQLLHGEEYIWATEEINFCKFLKTARVRNENYFMLIPYVLPTMTADNVFFKKLVNLTHNLRILWFSRNCYFFQHTLCSSESNSHYLTLTQITNAQLSWHGHLLSILFIMKLR